MEAIFEIVLQVILEVLVQVAGESLFESGLYGVRQVFKRAPASPAAAAVGYLVFGAIVGALSLWIFPKLFIDAAWVRWVNLGLSPIVAGVAMATIGRLRQRLGQTSVSLDTFLNAFLFAFAMAAVRLVWGH